MAQIRQFFKQRNVLEVETPILSSAGNTDVNIESFTTNAIDDHYPNSYLRTSPEFPLKRLLCSGIGDVFELGKVFRRGEVSSTHNIEFTMLEWYRINFDYIELIQETTELFRDIFAEFDKSFTATKIITFNDCFSLYLDIQPHITSIAKLNRICHTFGYCGSQLSRNAALDFLFATQIQPKLAPDTLTFVTLYPAAQAALAKINPDDINTALRFEVFFQGHELGNGYQELTNSQELLTRFKDDNLTRDRHSKGKIAIDYNLIAAMQHKMPACSGIAIGVDRLLMVVSDRQSIAEVIAFTAKNS